MKNKLILLIAVISISCTKNLKDEISNKDITIQVMRGKRSSKESEYKVRIFHEVKEGESVAKLNEKMQYHVDSCFYKAGENEKHYADAVIPVANGVRNCYEYVLVFDDKGEDQVSTINYDDKYITGKTYQLSLK